MFDTHPFIFPPVKTDGFKACPEFISGMFNIACAQKCAYGKPWRYPILRFNFVFYIYHFKIMNNTKITCIVPYSKGFLAGTDNGEVIIFEQSSDPPYVKRKTLVIELEQSTAMI